jgi:proteasome accessory factor C
VNAGATARLSRLLSMVPWLVQRPGIPIEDAAAHFGISERELVRDLELLFVCGTPGHLPDDLIEAEWESGRVFVGNADTIAKPLRLAVDEAVALLAGLRTLLDLPGLGDRQTVQSAIAKLAAQTQQLGGSADLLSVDLRSADGQDQATLRELRRALSARRRVWLRYLVPSRDESTTREVDPLQVTSIDGHWYLEGWCYRAESRRLFRVDRIVELRVLDLPADPPEAASDPVERASGDRLFTPSETDLVVTLDLDPVARWVAEYYPVESTEQRPDGVTRVRLRAASSGWVPRLVSKLAGAARVVEPAELAAATLARAEQALEAYAPD